VAQPTDYNPNSAAIVSIPARMPRSAGGVDDKDVGVGSVRRLTALPGRRKRPSCPHPPPGLPEQPWAHVPARTHTTR
jgi:hypothetical protein